MKKIVIICLVIFIVVLLYYQNTTGQDQVINEKETLPINQEQREGTDVKTQTKDEAQAVINNSGSPIIPEYKDVFKEVKVDTLENFQDHRDLKDIDEESKKLIEEAEKLISENDLVLPVQELSQEEMNDKQEQVRELDEIQEKLEELSNEN